MRDRLHSAREHARYHREHWPGDPHKHLHRELHRSYRYLRVARPLALLFNILVLYSLFRWFRGGWVTVAFAGFITLKEMIHLYFLWRMERGIFRPLERLRHGVESVAQGDYQVRVAAGPPNEIGLLIESFNKMARRLEEGEQTKARYEENRKALLMNISHDLKTPLASIQGHIEMIAEGQLASPDRLPAYLQIIAGNLRYLNRLVDDLFLFSKLDMDKLEFNFEAISIQRYLRDVTDELALELGEQGVAFCYLDQLPADLTVRIDRKRLHQVIRNLVDNAVKHGRRPELAVSMGLTADPAGVAITVADNGPGIPPEALPHIFDRFFRIERERPKELSSTGLGLAIARELVEAHGGSISVSSPPGSGACFEIKLPLAASEVSDDETGAGDRG